MQYVYFTASRSVLPALNDGTFEAALTTGIVIETIVAQNVQAARGDPDLQFC